MKKINNITVMMTILIVIGFNLVGMIKLTAKPFYEELIPTPGLNAYVNYTDKPGENVESRIYKYYDVVPNQICKIQMVFEPKNVKQCDPDVE